MADGKRIQPIKYLIIHHSVGPEFTNEKQQIVADWFSNVGRNRGYKGIAHSNHVDPRTNNETFAQAHYALQKHTTDPKNKYGWRLILMIKDPDNNVAWGAGNWPVNQQAINVEICGNYSTKKIDEKALLLLADFFKYLDKNGALQIKGHREVSTTGTSCPGKIVEQLPKLKDMFNHRSNYDYLLVNTPPTPPPPPIVVPPTPPPLPPALPVYEIRSNDTVLYSGTNFDSAALVYNVTVITGSVTFLQDGVMIGQKENKAPAPKPAVNPFESLLNWVISLFKK